MTCPVVVVRAFDCLVVDMVGGGGGCVCGDGDDGDVIFSEIINRRDMANS